MKKASLLMPLTPKVVENYGAIHGIQTHDLSITNRMLYQLS